jgi:hypothetical protein
MSPPEAPRLTFLAAVRVECDPPVDLGPAGEGRRVLFPIRGGTVSGPHLSGRVRPGGGDWATRRADGTTRVWARYALELDDGTVIGVTNAGTVRPGAGGTGREARTAAEFEVPDGPHAWLRERVILGTLATDPARAPGIVNLAFWLVN